jgi:hypothetical protein
MADSINVIFSEELKKLFSLKDPSSAEFQALFRNFKRDLQRYWVQSKAYKAHPKFRKGVMFYVKLDPSNYRVKVSLTIKGIRFEKQEIVQKARKPKKLLHSNRITKKVGGVEYKNLIPKDKKMNLRDQSRIHTYRQQAQQAQKKLRGKKTDFGVKEKASRWSLKEGRQFTSNRTLKSWGYRKGKRIQEEARPASPILRKGIGSKSKNVFKSPRKKIRYGTEKTSKLLDRDTKEDWGTEREEKKVAAPDNSATVKKYKAFISLIETEDFITKVLLNYAPKFATMLISKLNR